MTTFCTAIGELLMTAAMLAVPILCALSFAFDWQASIPLVLLSVIDFFWTFWCVIVTVGEMDT
jgi:hypothetical protein